MKKLLYLAQIILGIVLLMEANAQVVCPNPKAPLRIDSKITLILDESASMMSQREGLRHGVMGLLSELVCTEIEVAIIDFGSVAELSIPHTPITEQTLTNVFEAYFEETYLPLGCTNWDHAFELAGDLESDLIIFFTDGNPNTLAHEDPCDASHRAGLAATQVKRCALGDHSQVLALASGDVDLLHLEALAGPKKYEIGNGASVLDHDYLHVPDLTQIPMLFQALVTDLRPDFSFSSSPSCATSKTGMIAIENTNPIAGVAQRVQCTDQEGVVQFDGQIADSLLISSLTGGHYTVHIFAQHECSSPVVLEVEIPFSEYMLFGVDVTDASCSTTADGAMTMLDPVGNYPFQFSIDGHSFSSQSNFANLEPGIYPVVMKDVYGCTSVVKQIPIGTATPGLPIFENVPADTTLQCGDALPAFAQVEVTNNCGDSLAVSTHQEVIQDDCKGMVIERFWSVIHNNDFVTKTQKITVVDDEPPLLAVGEDLTLSFGSTAPPPEHQVTDVCSEVQVSFHEDFDTLPDGSVVISRQWVARDWCENSTEKHQVIAIAAPSYITRTIGAKFVEKKRNENHLESLSYPSSASAIEALAHANGIIGAKAEKKKRNENQLEALAYPSPASDYFKLQYSSSRELHFQLIGPLGVAIRHGTMPAGTDEVVRFDLKYLPCGIYRLVLLPPGGTAMTESILKL